MTIKTTNRVTVGAVLAALAGVMAGGRASSAAVSTSFGVNVVDAGGVPGGSLGSPITWTPGNAAFDPGFGSDIPPEPGSILASPALEYDSYLAMDPIGPSTPASSFEPVAWHHAWGPANIIRPDSPSTCFAPGRLAGIWYSIGSNGGFQMSGVGPNGRSRLFIAQITLRPGTSAPTTAGVYVNIRDAGTLNPDGELGALRFGEANASNNGGKWGQAYYLEAVAREAFRVPSAFAGGTSYAIYVVALPAPGSAALLVLFGAATIRRRRR